MKGCGRMPEQEHRKSPEESENQKISRPQGEISVFHNAMEIEAELRRKAELAERERQKKEAEAAYQAREAYAKELAEEKVELMRAKQGLITEEELDLPKEEEKHYTTWQKIGNWFYHSKWWLWGAIFCALVGGFLIFDFITREKPDIRVLVLSGNTELEQQTQALEEWIRPVCEDYNKDGKTYVSAVQIPISKELMESETNYSVAYRSQLTAQFQADLCMLVIADRQSDPYLPSGDLFVDLEELYPDCSFADGCHLWLNSTDLAAQIGMTEPLPEGCYLALRKPQASMVSESAMKTAYDRAKAVLDGIVPMLHNQ